MCLKGLALMLRVRWPVLLLDQRGFLVLQHECCVSKVLLRHTTSKVSRVAAHLESIQMTGIVMCALKQKAAKGQQFFFTPPRIENGPILNPRRSKTSQMQQPDEPHIGILSHLTYFTSCPYCLRYESRGGIRRPGLKHAGRSGGTSQHDVHTKVQKMATAHLCLTADQRRQS
jgi:hypothetical protein